jgi:hypothetical protein
MQQTLRFAGFSLDFGSGKRDAPDKNRTCARGLGNRSDQVPVVRLRPLRPPSTVLGVRLSPLGTCPSGVSR